FFEPGVYIQANAVCRGGAPEEIPELPYRVGADAPAEQKGLFQGVGPQQRQSKPKPLPPGSGPRLSKRKRSQGSAYGSRSGKTKSPPRPKALMISGGASPSRVSSRRRRQYPGLSDPCSCMADSPYSLVLST